MPKTDLPRRIIVRDRNQKDGVINDDTILMSPTVAPHQRSIRKR